MWMKLKSLVWGTSLLSPWCVMFFLHGEAAGFCGVGGGGRAGLGGRDAVEPPGDRGGELVPFTAWGLGTMTHSSESLEGDESLLDLQVQNA